MTVPHNGRLLRSSVAAEGLPSGRPQHGFLGDGGSPEEVETHVPSLSLVGAGRRLRSVRAWMLGPPVDAVLLSSPALWAPQHWKASAAMAVLFLLLLSSDARYRARLHLSGLDELPALVGKLLIAGAVVATLTALRHEKDSVATFLVDSAIGIGLVIAGRVLLTQLILWSRRHRVTVHPTILIGGGSLAGELAHILRRHPQYRLAVKGFVDDGGPGAAEKVVPRLGGTADLD